MNKAVAVGDAPVTDGDGIKAEVTDSDSTELREPATASALMVQFSVKEEEAS